MPFLSMMRFAKNTTRNMTAAASAPKPILMGRDLIALGYTPSPQFGVWLDACFDAQLDGAFSDHDGALAWFKAKFE